MTTCTKDRWYCDGGSIPGEPFLYLDVPEGASTDYASAYVLQIDNDDPEFSEYQAIIPGRNGFHGESYSLVFSQLEEAKAWAEAQIPIPQPHVLIDVHPEWWIEHHYQPAQGEILIAITEPKHEPVTPHRPFAATYHLPVWDIPYTIDHPTTGRLIPMTAKQADDLLQFVLQYRNCMTALTVSCAAGVSRSPAVGIALSEWLPTLPETPILIGRYPGFNRPIYRTLCQQALVQGVLKS